MKYQILLCSILLLFTACNHRDPPPVHCQLVQKFMHRFIQDAEKQYRMVCSLEGGEFLGQINGIHLGFDTIGPMSVEELRRLIVQVAEELLDRINADEEIREYLANYPFRSTNLELSIWLRGSDLERIKNKGANTDLLYGAVLLHGKLRFVIENEEKPSLQTVKRETYDEALEIVRTQDSLPSLSQ
ncbi:MAG: hypothetical protein K940chlam7_00986 [Chlamydiae bacterium]|nr:hypothetical protein [Chlamydiota bacterium]